jgi:hypothetical protein
MEKKRKILLIGLGVLGLAKLIKTSDSSDTVQAVSLVPVPRSAPMAGRNVSTMTTTNTNTNTTTTAATQKYIVVKNIVAGTNTITHNLSLNDPRGFLLKAIDTATNNAINISNFNNITANSFEFESAIAFANVHFTVF